VKRQFSMIKLFAIPVFWYREHCDMAWIMNTLDITDKFIKEL
jgi:hypothetical protein